MFWNELVISLIMLIYQSDTNLGKLPVIHGLRPGYPFTIGAPLCEPQAYIQRWDLVDPDNPFNAMKVLRGTVVNNYLNIGKGGIGRCRIHDQDWCIHIKPFQEYGYLAYNLKHNLNQRKKGKLAGSVEAELRIADPVSALDCGIDPAELFPPGSPVEVYGRSRAAW